VEEAAALHDLGFDSYDAFASVHGAAAPADETEAVAPSEPAPNSSGNSFGGAFGAPLGEPTPPPVVETPVTSSAGSDEEPESAGETIGRIRMLLDELGIEPGGDPLQAAKQFLDVVEGGSPAAEGDDSFAHSDQADRTRCRSRRDFTTAMHR